MNAKQEAQATFWCGVLAPVLFGRLKSAEERRELRRLATQRFVFPDGHPGTVSLKTLQRKLKLYRRAGFNALIRKARSDRGQPRVAPAEVIATAVAAKKEQPRRSALMLNRLLTHRHGQSVPRSTLYRHLKAAGATRLKLGVSTEPVRKRWSCAHTHDLWVGDFQDGPYVLVGGVSVLTVLSAFIDAHSRHIVSGRYYLRENFDVLCDTLLRAFEVHGIPHGLYLDNAKVFHAEALQRACYRLGIRLLHRPVSDPAPGGLIERFFQTVQSQFEAEVRAAAMLTHERLNEAFRAWLDVVYHRTPNAETHQSPQQRYAEGLLAIRQADMQAVAESFLQRELRTVDKTFSDIRLHKRFYQVDPKLRGDRLEVRYDPFGPREEILLYSLHDEYLGKGRLHQREEGQSTPRPADAPPLRFDLLGMLIEQQRHEREQASGQIDYTAALRPTRWPFQAFAACFAELLGRRGGLSAFSAEELAALEQVHARHPQLTRTRLKQAFARTEHPTLPAVVYQLQHLQED